MDLGQFNFGLFHSNVSKLFFSVQLFFINLSHSHSLHQAPPPLLNQQWTPPPTIGSAPLQRIDFHPLPERISECTQTHLSIDLSIYLSIWVPVCEGCNGSLFKQKKLFRFCTYAFKTNRQTLIRYFQFCILLLSIRNKVSSLKFCPFCQEIKTINAVLMLFDVAW